ncbi:MAG: alpha/beta hydrolase [Hyphomonadaceae bacterium]
MKGEESGTVERRGIALAYKRLEGAGPTLVWLGGFMSDMEGTKAQALADWAAARGQAFLRFDYAGHGRSGGAFAEQTIGAWADDALAVIEAKSEGPLILVGSSMGAWIALLAAQRLTRVSALLLIAPAVDFTERLLWARLPAEVRQTILKEGRWERPSAYGETPYPITKALVEEGRDHLLMDAPIPFAGRVIILQGQADPDVPWAHAMAVAEKLTAADVEITLIKDGDHRLSRPRDLALLTAAAGRLSKA